MHQHLTDLKAAVDRALADIQADGAEPAAGGAPAQQRRRRVAAAA
jgi:hypothetical protein